MEKFILIKPPKATITDLTMGQFFYQFAHQHTNRICQIDARTQKSETFLSVHEKSARVAMEMKKNGVTSGDIILTCMASKLEAVIPVIATFYLGATIANLDVSLSISQTTRLLSLFTPKMVFVDEEAIPLIEESLKAAGLKTIIVVLGETRKYFKYDDFLKPQPKEDLFLPSDVSPENPAVIFFSSGTTGLPKGIVHSGRGFLHQIFNFPYEDMNFDVSMSFTSFYWTTAMIYLCLSYVTGGHRVICGNDVDPKFVLGTIDKYKVTLMFTAPILAAKLIDFYENSPNYNLSSIKTYLCGGTHISLHILKKLMVVFNKAVILNTYGQTEIGHITTVDQADKTKIEKKFPSCGKLIPGMSLKVVDPETKEIKGPNEKGEFYVKSSSLMLGYYNLDCGELFDEDGFLATGDIGYYDEEGWIYLVDRIKDMFKYKSWHIVPSMLEEVLQQHPAVQQAFVFGTPINAEEGEVPTACIIPKKEILFQLQEILDFFESKVSDREKLRGGLHVVEDFPKTPTGKVKRLEAKTTFLYNNNVLK